MTVCSVVNTMESANAFDKLLEKYELCKALRVSAWVNRFIKDCHHSKQSSSLTTSEIEKQRKYTSLYLKSEHERLESSDKFQQDHKSLNLVQNIEGIFKCRGRIEGNYPIYLPKESLLPEKNIWVPHKKTMHAEVTITMSNISTYY